MCRLNAHCQSHHNCQLYLLMCHLHPAVSTETEPISNQTHKKQPSQRSTPPAREPQWGRDESGRLQRKTNFANLSEQEFRSMKASMSRKDKATYYVSLCVSKPITACRLSRKKRKYKQRLAYRRMTGDLLLGAPMSLLGVNEP